MEADNQKLIEAREAVLDSYQTRTAELHALFAPTWNARADTLKTIISISSASIVLSVTFSSSLRQINAGSLWRFLVIASFTLFVLALVTSFWALWAGAGVYQMQSRLLDKRHQMTTVLMTASSAEEIQQSLEKILRDALEPIYERDNHVTTAYIISGICFSVAVISLAVVGAIRLLY